MQESFENNSNVNQCYLLCPRCPSNTWKCMTSCFIVYIFFKCLQSSFTSIWTDVHMVISAVFFTILHHYLIISGACAYWTKTLKSSSLLCLEYHTNLVSKNINLLSAFELVAFNKFPTEDMTKLIYSFLVCLTLWLLLSAISCFNLNFFMPLWLCEGLLSIFILNVLEISKTKINIKIFPRDISPKKKERKCFFPSSSSHLTHWQAELMECLMSLVWKSVWNICRTVKGTTGIIIISQ